MLCLGYTFDRPPGSVRMALCTCCIIIRRNCNMGIFLGMINSLKKINERIEFEKEMATKSEEIEEKYGYPKITSTAHYQKAAILEWSLSMIQKELDEATND